MELIFNGTLQHFQVTPKLIWHGGRRKRLYLGFNFYAM